jgi:hypothetical protein
MLIFGYDIHEKKILNCSYKKKFNPHKQVVSGCGSGA